MSSQRFIRVSLNNDRIVYGPETTDAEPSNAQTNSNIRIKQEPANESDLRNTMDICQVPVKVEPPDELYNISESELAIKTELVADWNTLMKVELPEEVATSLSSDNKDQKSVVMETESSPNSIDVSECAQSITSGSELTMDQQPRPSQNMHCTHSSTVSRPHLQCQETNETSDTNHNSHQISSESSFQEMTVSSTTHDHDESIAFVSPSGTPLELMTGQYKCCPARMHGVSGVLIMPSSSEASVDATFLPTSMENLLSSGYFSLQSKNTSSDVKTASAPMFSSLPTSNLRIESATIPSSLSSTGRSPAESSAGVAKNSLRNGCEYLSPLELSLEEQQSPVIPIKSIFPARLKLGRKYTKVASTNTTSIITPFIHKNTRVEKMFQRQKQKHDKNLDHHPLMKLTRLPHPPLPPLHGPAFKRRAAIASAITEDVSKDNQVEPITADTDVNGNDSYPLIIESVVSLNPEFPDRNINLLDHELGQSGDTVSNNGSARKRPKIYSCTRSCYVVIETQIFVFNKDGMIDVRTIRKMNGRHSCNVKCRHDCLMKLCKLSRLPPRRVKAPPTLYAQTMLTTSERESFFQSSRKKRPPQSSLKNKRPVSWCPKKRKMTSESTQTSMKQKQINQSKSEVLHAGTEKEVQCDLSEQDIAGESTECLSANQRLKGRPRRPCKYCGKFQAQLGRHLKRQHKDVPEVQVALRLPTRDSQRAMAQIRKDGIYKENDRRTKQQTLEPMLRERCQGNDDIVICSGCHGVYGRPHIWKHKQLCQEEQGVYVKLDSIPMSAFTPCDRMDDDLQKAMSKMRQDSIGNICQEDNIIISLAIQLWAESVKRNQKVITSDLRRVGKLLQHFRNAADNQTMTARDMLARANFEHLEEAIKSMTVKDNSLSMKDDLMLTLGYLIKTMIKIVKSQYVAQGNMEQVTEMDQFLSVFEYNWDFIFYRSEINVDNHGPPVLQKPQALTLKQDVANLKAYTMDRIKHLADECLQWDCNNFTEMRSLIVSRLTLFNARRGGQPARLTLKEWKDASSDAWVDPQLIETVSDPMEKALFEISKLAYQCAKDSRKQVPVLIPLDTIPGIKKLVSERKNIGIFPKNQYLFPYTQKSMDHVLGWACVKEITKKANLENPRLITATKCRHRASIVYTLQDIPENERQIFYRYLGHSTEIIKDVYQCPLDVREITAVGSYLQSIDGNGKTGLPVKPKEAAPVKPKVTVPVKAPPPMVFDVPPPSATLVEPVVKATSEEEEAKSEPANKKRTYIKWSEADNKTISTYFGTWIFGSGYPSKEHVLIFMNEHPQIHKSCKIIQRKVMNNKRQYQGKMKRKRQQQHTFN